MFAVNSHRFRLQFDLQFATLKSLTTSLVTECCSGLVNLSNCSTDRCTSACRSAPARRVALHVFCDAHLSDIARRRAPARQCIVAQPGEQSMVCSLIKLFNHQHHAANVGTCWYCTCGDCCARPRLLRFCVVLLFAALEDAYDSAIGANKIAWSRSLHFKYVVLSSTARAGIVVSGLTDQRKKKNREKSVASITNTKYNASDHENLHI
jgi:hypothetical protein